MKRSLLQLGVCLAAALMITAADRPANGQGQEYIVDAHVVSDTVVGGDGTSSSYVGDMSCSAAGCGDCGSCGGGSCGLFGGCCRGSDCYSNGGPRQYGQPDLFYNYYAQGSQKRANAQMYISPLPTPPNVGHTFFTYQPFYPHEMLYWHKNRFHNYYDGGRGMNRTKAVYYSPPVRQALSNFYWNKIRLPR